MAKSANNALAEIIRKYPERFSGYAALAPKRPEQAARELERAVKELGLKGWKTHSNYGDSYIDEKVYWPILAKAEELDVPIYLHPTATIIPQLRAYGFALAGTAFGFGVEPTAMAMMRLVLGGVFDVWHIECSAMNLRYLGEQIDIHGGGNDLVFPHHENEIAQSESFTDRAFARFWIHNGMLQLGGEKMSKSLGNLITIDEFLEQHTADVFRMVVLNSSYRGPLTFTEAVLEQAASALERLRSALRSGEAAATPSPQAGQALEDKVREVVSGFETAMADDFNTAGALAQLFDLVSRAVLRKPSDPLVVVDCFSPPGIV